MRIIAGEFKGHIITVPKSKLVRPTTDKTRESIFNFLQNKIDFYNMKVLDLYAGSGSLGLEALSRGASLVHFVEKNFQIYKNLIGNIKHLKVSDRSKVFKLPCIKFCSNKKNAGYDLILADPPFFQDDIHLVYEKIVQNHFLNENGLLLIERSIQTKENDVKQFKKEPIKKLGDSLIYMFDFL